ncbi:site-specific integrase [Tunturiibacter gelidoferens]|uniref:Integrase n=1 Tax=Tunturiibacter gelidiferens TaxID=3069689 RepID=A0ACC5P3K7_9BACT|nr:site-specific integrase [Edaphobacter lichenicola]MBB5341417.1 integrase [Edaphobacter lichenicola]
MGTTHQRGYVTPRGKQWYGYYRKVVNDPATNEPKSVRIPVSLGPKSKMTKTEARQTLEREITKQLGQPGSPTRIMNDGSVTFAWFVTNRFLPLKEAVWKEETAKTKKILIQLDLVEPLGEIPLINFDKFSLQLHLNKLATTGSKDRVLQMRAYLRDIFAEAVDQDFLVKDPARKIKVPAQLRATDTTTLTWDQLRLALSKLNLRDRILLELDMTNALRPSELFAFRWKRFDYQASTLTVAETVYKGNIRDWGKTKKSLTVIHIPLELADDLQAWRLECEERAQEAAAKDKTKSPFLSEDDFIFANEVGGFLDTDNYRKRVLHKLARDLGLPKLTFQVIRRTIATLAQKKGTVKDVQGVMRHSRTATTTDVYMQEIPASVQSTINSINRELRGLRATNRKKSASTGAVVEGRRKAVKRLAKPLTQDDTKSLREGGRLLPVAI